MDQGEDRAASARALRALSLDVQELRAEHSNLRVSHANFVFDQSWVNQCVESVIERLNEILAEANLLKARVQQIHSQNQVSVDALHLRVRVLEEALPLLSARIGQSEESLVVAEASFDSLRTRVSTLETHLQLDALD